MLNKKNVVMLDGGLTRDAELAPSGKIIICSLGVDGSGSVQGETNPSGYFNVKIFLTPSKFSPAVLAEDAQKLYDEGNLVKGTRMGVVGRLVQERWTDKDGVKRERTVVMAESIDVFRGKGAGAGGGNTTGTVEAAASMSASTSIDDF